MQLAFDVATYRDRIERARQMMRENDLGALVVTLPDSIHWLTGYDTIGYLWSQALVIDLSGDDPTLLTRTSEEPGFKESTWLEGGTFYDITQVHPMAVLAGALRDRGAADGRVGIELHAFTLLPAWYEELKAQLPEATFVDSTELVPELRLVKSPQELYYQRQAAEMADYAMAQVFEALRPGVSETEIAGIASLALGEVGSEYAAIPPMVVSGPRSALVHAMPSRRSIAMGDVVCIEMAGVVNRYHGILMRSAVIGKPMDRVADVAACLGEAMEAAIEAASPGTPSKVPDDVCNGILERLDLARRRCHRLGYSAGIAYPPGWLEPMTLVEGDPHILAPGMSFTIEPNLTLQDQGFGLKMGEIVECTPAGGKSMSRLDHSLVVID